VLLSQSALQIHPSSAAAAASLDHRYVVDDDAELQCQWDPVIPFAGARLVQRFAIDLAASSRLYWGDAIMAGRVRRGEAWRFESLAHELRLSSCGSPIYLERYTLAPARRPVEQTWVAGRARYLATALVRHPRATAAAAEVLQSATAAGAHAGVDLLGPGAIVGRILAADGAAFSRARAAFLSQAQQIIFEAPGWTARK
jgi:urease accessory protein